MKTTTTICIAIALCAASAVHSHAVSRSYTRNFNIPEPTVEEREDPDGNSYQEVSFEGFHNDEEYGTPSLGWETITVELPYGATDLKATVSSWSGERKLILDKTLWPCQRPMETSLNPTWEFTGLDPFAYTASSGTPAVKILGDGLIAGKRHVATVAIRPFGYSFAESTLSSYSSVTFTLDYKINLTVAPVTSNGTGITAVEKALVSNAITSGFELSFLKSAIVADIDKPAIGSYYIIVPRSLKDAVGKLALWKTQKGYDVTVKVVEEIFSDPTFKVGATFSFNNRDEEIVDEAASLRAYLQSEFQKKGSFYCFLIGNSETSMPIRRIYNNSKSKDYDYFKNPEGDAFIPSDNYFSDLTTNWNINKRNPANHYSGYIYTTFYPDIIVGRLLCHSPREIENYVEKLICYESCPGYGNNDYLGEALYFEQDKSNGGSLINNSDKVREVFDIFGDEHTLLVRDYCVQQKTEDGNGETIPHFGKDIIGYMNKSGFISAHGHGCPTLIGVCDNNRFIVASDEYSKDQLYATILSDDKECGFNRLDNFSKPSVMYSISCINAPYDHYTYMGDSIKDPSGKLINFGDGHCFDVPFNLAESFTVASKAGGVAYLGNSRNGLISSSADLESYFCENILNVNKIGIAEALSKTRTNNSFVRSTHNLIGDPEFDMWLGKPIPTPLCDSITYGGKIIMSGGIDGMEASIFDFRLQTTQPLCISTTTDIDFGDKLVSVWKSQHLPLIKYYALDGCCENCQREIICTDAVIGGSYTDFTFDISENGKIGIECSGNVSLNKGLTVKKGGTLDIVARGICTVSGIKVEKEGTLNIIAGKVIVSEPMEIESGSKITISNHKD